MALCGTLTVSTCGLNVSLSTNTEYRATSLYLYTLTAGNSFYLDITTTSGCSTGFTVPPATMVQFTHLGGIKGFSTIASSAGGSMSVSYLASR